MSDYQLSGKHQQKAKIHDTKITYEELQDLFSDLATKRKQIRNYKFFAGVLNYYYVFYLKVVDNKFFRKNREAIKEIGTGNQELLNADKSKLKAYSNFLIGTDENLQPIYVNNLNQHMGLFGASGSGKSVFLFNLLQQVLEKGGGACFIDGKGDTKMFDEFARWAEDYNRLDDVIVLNFNPGSDSNTFNIFEALGIKEAQNVLAAILFPANAKQDFFTEQAKQYFNIVFEVLKYLYYVKGEKITLRTFQQASNLKAVVVNKVPADKNDSTKPDEKILNLNDLAGFRKFWVEKTYQNEIKKVVSNEIINFIDKYGANVKMGTEDDDEDEPLISDQLQQQIGGYSSMQLGKLTELSDLYDNIFNSPKNDIDFVDIISQNKLVYVLIPKMKIAEKALPIGSFLISAIMNAVGQSLGDEVVREESFINSFNNTRITANPTFLLVLDEMSAFIGQAKDPLEQILAQARSVNISAIVSSQEVASLKAGEGGESFVERILANTATQVFLRARDAATADKAKNIIKSLLKEVDEEGKEKNQDFEEVSTFLSSAEKGLGIVLNKSYGKFLTPWAEPKTQKSSFRINR